MRKTAVLLFCSFFICLCGCRRSQYRGVEYVQYQAPTLVATAVNTPTVNPIIPLPTAVDINCNSYLTYLDDVTVPDGTTFVPGDEIVKTWSVRNDGDCTWNDKYSLRYIDGSAMEANSRQSLPELAPGEEGEVTVIFTAPQVAGRYYSGWQAYDAKGDPFGDDIYIEIYVDPYHTIDETQEESGYEQQYGYGYYY